MTISRSALASYPSTTPSAFLSVYAERSEMQLAQRDVLVATAYRLTLPTPEPYLSELRAALPALRALLGARAWARATARVWEVLLRALFGAFSAALCLADG